MQASRHTGAVRARRWLSPKTFELVIDRPDGFAFRPGQRIGLTHEGVARDYSLASGTSEAVLRLCVRHLPRGKVSAWLAACALGTDLTITGPSGYFQYFPSDRRSVFVATGTGVAPFHAMAASGITGFTLLHGVSHSSDLYYRSLFERAASLYVPCIPGQGPAPATMFTGRVTDYLRDRLAPDAYDFYLCGRGDMVRDATLLVDDLFPDARVYAETFY